MKLGPSEYKTGMMLRHFFIGKGKGIGKGKVIPIQARCGPEGG